MPGVDVGDNTVGEVVTTVQEIVLLALVELMFHLVGETDRSRIYRDDK